MNEAEKNGILNEQIKKNVQKAGEGLSKVPSNAVKGKEISEILSDLFGNQANSLFYMLGASIHATIAVVGLATSIGSKGLKTAYDIATRHNVRVAGTELNELSIESYTLSVAIDALEDYLVSKKHNKSFDEYVKGSNIAYKHALSVAYAHFFYKALSNPSKYPELKELLEHFGKDMSSDWFKAKYGDGDFKRNTIESIKNFLKDPSNYEKFVEALQKNPDLLQEILNVAKSEKQELDKRMGELRKNISRSHYAQGSRESVKLNILAAQLLALAHSKNQDLQKPIQKDFLEPLNAELRGRYGVEARLEYVASDDPAIDEPVLSIVYYAINDQGKVNLEQKMSEIDDVTARRFESFALSSKFLSDVYKQVDDIAQKYGDKLAKMGFNVPVGIGEMMLLVEKTDHVVKFLKESNETFEHLKIKDNMRSAVLVVIASMYTKDPQLFDKALQEVHNSNSQKDFNTAVMEKFAYRTAEFFNSEEGQKLLKSLGLFELRQELKKDVNNFAYYLMREFYPNDFKPSVDSNLNLSHNQSSYSATQLSKKEFELFVQIIANAKQEDVLYAVESMRQFAVKESSNIKNTYGMLVPFLLAIATGVEKFKENVAQAERQHQRTV